VTSFRDEANAGRSPTPGTCGKYIWRALKGLASVSCLAALLVSLPPRPSASAADSGVGPAADGATRLAVSRKEVEQLLLDLESSERVKRERAFDRLVQVEPPVRVEELESLWQHENVDVRRVTLRLIAALQEKHGVNSVRVNGLEFLPCVDLVWRMSSAGDEKPIKLDLKITNVGKKTVRYFDFGMPGFRLWDADGECLRYFSGADGFSPNVNCYSLPLKKGESRTTSRLLKESTLRRSIDGKKLDLVVRDGTGMFHSFSDLKPGRYYLSFECSCRLAPKVENTPLVWDGLIRIGGDPPKDGVPLWQGQADTPIVAVEIQ
jgi:hypothetical protein